jgi:MFS family permease
MSGHESAPAQDGNTEPRSPVATVSSASGETGPTYRDVLAVRPYRYLFLGHLLSLLGDQLTRVALAVLVFDRTGSAALAAVAFAVTLLPWIVGGPLLSSFADRFPRRRVMVAADLGRAALVTLMIIPVAPTGMLIGLAFLANMLTPAFSSARAAMLPDLLAGDRYVIANGLDRITQQLAQVGGFLAGGALIALIHPGGALALDAATFATSAALILIGVLPVPAPHGGGDRFSAWRDTAIGMRVVFGNPVLRAYVVLFWVASAFTYSYYGTVVPYAAVLGGGAPTAGLLLAAGPFGLAAGAVVLTRVLSPRRRMRALVPCAVVSVVALVPALAVHHTVSVVTMLVVAGFGSAFSVPLNALFVRAAPSAFRGRAFGVAQAGVQVTQGLGILAAGLGAQITGSPALVVAASGILGTIAVVAVVAMIWPRDAFHRGAEPVLRS